MLKKCLITPSRFEDIVCGLVGGLKGSLVGIGIHLTIAMVGKTETGDMTHESSNNIQVSQHSMSNPALNTPANLTKLAVKRAEKLLIMPHQKE